MCIRDRSKYLKIMCEKRVDGLILIGGGIVQDAEEQDFLERTGVKIMVIGKPHNTKLASVQIKNIEAAREACTYLIGLGHRRIAVSYTHLLSFRTTQLHL